MEYLDGRDARRARRRSRARCRRDASIHVLRQVGAALREAHDARIDPPRRQARERDAVPPRRGRRRQAARLRPREEPRAAQTRDVTKQIRILGTPRYMAPERIVNPADVDARSDIYALGAVGYYLLTGKAIFDGDDDLEHQQPGAAHAGTARVRERRRGGPRRRSTHLIAACLEKDRRAGRSRWRPSSRRSTASRAGSRGRRTTRRRGGTATTSGGGPPARPMGRNPRSAPLPRPRLPMRRPRTFADGPRVGSAGGAAGTAR